MPKNHHKPFNGYSDKWYADNREEILKKSKDKNKAHPEIKKSYYQKNIEKMREKNKKYYQDNIEKMREKNRSWKKKNKDRAYQHNRKSQLKNLYGITMEQYDSMYNSQNGKCAICKYSDNGKKKLAVDHNHQTNKIRGLLCRHCNQALGFFLDSVTTLNSAIHYLNLHS